MNKKRIFAILGAVSIGLILIAAVLQVVAMLTVYEDNFNYFERGAVLPAVSAILALVGAAIGIVAAVLTPCREINASPFAKTPWASLPSTVTFALAGITLLLQGSALTTFTALFCFLAAVHTVLCGLPGTRNKYANTVALFGFAATIACALLNACYYFDMTVEMNSPLKALTQLPLLFAMLYYLGEIRFLIGRDSPRLFLGLTICTLAASALSAIAFPVAFAAGIVTRFDYVSGAILALGICITALCRAYTLLSPIWKRNQCAHEPEDIPAENDSKEEQSE